ncbi:MAG: phosphoribosylglycinamide formyltransferase [Nitrospirae bacterium GWD2_57_9]|nr:MAG: phosphoribosylglycinamide formyltransferase [Nitrospirae bacterium GWD2_57_9]OGW49294.1 MAG: phosphoribosylglycinamide formyltransferase [Nitrospirae bacterium GWC2_57_9]
MKKVKLGVLVSGRGSNLQAVIDNIEKGTVSAQVAVVISDQPDAFALDRARKHNLPAVHVSAKGYKGKRDEYDALLEQELRKHGVELVILAGFMRIITKVLVNAFPNRIMNIHPALLPSFPGLHVQKAAIEHGVKFSGCTVHFVDEGMDTGPIIIQAVVPVLDNDTEDTLAARILKQEHRIFSRAIHLYAEGRLTVKDRRVFVSGPENKSGEFLINP